MALVENATHVIFGSRIASLDVGEQTLAEEVVTLLKPGMLCLADRGFNGYPLWNLAKGTGPEWVWRLRKDLVLPREKELPDGSYLSTLHPSRAEKDGRDIMYWPGNFEGFDSSGHPGGAAPGTPGIYRLTPRNGQRA